MADLSEAAARVAHLDAFPFEDDFPNIEAASSTLSYDSYIDYNYADRDVYDTEWTSETTNIALVVLYLI
jgi:hypothetical protein